MFYTSMSMTAKCEGQKICQRQLLIKVKHQCQVAKDQASVSKSAKGQTTMSRST